MHIIDKNKYNNFIDSNKNITNCQKKYFIIMLNIQINTLLNNIYKNKLLMNLTKLKLLFNNFFTYKFINKLFKKIRSENMNDDQIISYILKKRKLSNIEIKNEHSNYKICDMWTYIFENLSLYYLNYLNQNKLSIDNIKYLNIGCGSGSKTIKFSKILKINSNNIN
jgi:hypothetical protein